MAQMSLTDLVDANAAGTKYLSDLAQSYRDKAADLTAQADALDVEIAARQTVNDSLNKLAEVQVKAQNGDVVVFTAPGAPS